MLVAYEMGFLKISIPPRLKGVVAYRLTHWTLGRKVLVRDEAWCSVFLGTQHFILTAPLSTQEYKWGTSQPSEKADKMSGG